MHDKFEDQIKFENNRNVVNIPFKEGHPLMEDNFNLSMNRLENLMKKLKWNPELLKQYDDVIKQQRDLGIIKKAEDEGKLGEPIIYHIVILFGRIKHLRGSVLYLIPQINLIGQV